MLTDKQVLQLIERLPDGEAGLRVLFNALGFQVRSDILPMLDDKEWQEVFYARPRQVAFEENSFLSVLWFPVRRLSDDSLQRILHNYHSQFSTALFLFSEPGNSDWKWILKTSSLSKSCSFCIEEPTNALIKMLKSLCIPDHGYAFVSLLLDFSVCIELVGDFNRINKTYKRVCKKLLTHEEEVDLAKKIEKGGCEAEKAQEILLGANLRLVTHMAMKYLNRGVEFDDLIQEGRIGLLKATQKYDWRLGYRFSTYATHWIRQALGRSVENDGRTIRVPSHFQETMHRIRQAQKQLYVSLSQEPTAEDIAREIGRPTKEIYTALAVINTISMSFDSIIPGTNLVLRDVIPASVRHQPEQLAEEAAVREAIVQSLKLLTAREREVLVLRFGLDSQSQEGRTLEEVGQIIQLSRERARQIEVKALQKLRSQPAGAFIRITLGSNEDLPCITNESASEKKSGKSKEGFCLPDKKEMSPEEKADWLRQVGKEIRKRQCEKLPIKSSSVIKEVVDDICQIPLMLFTEEELQDLSAPFTKDEVACDKCGNLVEVKPTFGGKFYRCRNCRNMRLL